MDFSFLPFSQATQPELIDESTLDVPEFTLETFVDQPLGDAIETPSFVALEPEELEVEPVKEDISEDVQIVEERIPCYCLSCRDHSTMVVDSVTHAQRTNRVVKKGRCVRCDKVVTRFQ